jgi:transcription initiation factor TFIID TATA-box-binding protein
MSVGAEYEVEETLAVGAGELPVEVDLEVLAETISVEYDLEKPGLEIRPKKSRLPLMTLFTSGRFILRAGSEDELFEEFEGILDGFEAIGLVDEDQRDDVEFEVSNSVLLADVPTSFNLSTLAVGLGFQNAEYEPEQHSAIIYTTDEYDCTFSIFHNGKITVAGSPSANRAVESFENFLGELEIWM